MRTLRLAPQGKLTAEPAGEIPTLSLPKGKDLYSLTAKFRLHPQRLQVSFIHATPFQADTLQQLGKSTGDRLLVRPGLQPLFHVRRTPRKLGKLHNLSPVGRLDDADHR